MRLWRILEEFGEADLTVCCEDSGDPRVVMCSVVYTSNILGETCNKWYQVDVGRDYEVLEVYRSDGVVPRIGNMLYLSGTPKEKEEQFKDWLRNHQY